MSWTVTPVVKETYGEVCRMVGYALLAGYAFHNFSVTDVDREVAA